MVEVIFNNETRLQWYVLFFILLGTIIPRFIIITYHIYILCGDFLSFNNIILRTFLIGIQKLQRKVWRCQRGNQKSLIEGHTITNDWATGTPLKPGDELGCSRRVSSSCSTSGTRRDTLVTNPVISHEWENDRIVGLR